MTLDIFKEIFCKVSLIDNKGFGLYPFPMACVSKQDEINIYSLALNRVQEYYTVFTKALFDESKVIHLAVDFPNPANDFLQVFSYEAGNYSYTLLPYNRVTGEYVEPSTELKQLGEQIFSQFKQHILNTWKRK